MAAKDANWQRLQRQIVACVACPRLREYCRQIAALKRRAYADWDYWARPVPNLGRPPARLLIVGLAPAAHGANRTGRMFTGDRSGLWLFRALHKAGFANQSQSASQDDGLALIDCVITAVCHCAPPDNKPTNEEVGNCRTWLSQTIDQVQPRLFLALGQVAWRAVLAEARQRTWHTGSLPRFAHGAEARLTGERRLVASYHPSQQNTFTGKLTEPMFDALFARLRTLIDAKGEREA